MSLDKYDPTSPMGQALAAVLGGTQLMNPAAADVMRSVVPDAPPQGGIGSQIGWAADAVLGAPRRALWSPAGDISQALGVTQQGGIKGFDEGLRTMRTDPVMQQFSRYNPAIAGVMAVDQALGPEVGDVAMETLTDPLTLIGGPGKAVGSRLIAAADKGLGRMPATTRAVGQALFTADDAVSSSLGKMASTLVKGVQDKAFGPINASLGRAFPTLPLWTELSKRSSIAADVAQMLDDRGIDPVTAQVWWDMTPSDLTRLLPQGMLRDIGPHMNDFMAAVAKSNTWDEAVNLYQKQTRSALGLGGKNAYMNAYAGFQNWWKRQALASVAYPITNALGGMLGYAAEGGDPRKIAQDLWANAGRLWNGADFHIDDAVKLSKETEMPIPESLRREAGYATHSQLGTVVTNREVLRDAAILGALGGLQQGSQEDGNFLMGVAVGALGGAGVAKMAGKVQHVSKGIETVLRERGWVEGMGKELIDATADMEGVVRAAMAQPRNPAAGRSRGSIPHPNIANYVASLINAQGGRISAADVMDHLAQWNKPGRAGGGGIQGDVLEAAGSAIDDILYDASQAGKATSEAFNFNYDDLSNIERIVSNVAPFSTWLMKAAPYYFVKSAEHPWAANLARTWNAKSEEYRGENGLTTRVSGSLPWHGISPLTEAIFGRHTTTLINPIAGLLPAGNLGQGLDRLEYDESLSGKLAGAAEAVGLGTNPLVGMGLRIAGMGDQDDPAQGIPLRAGGLINALTGVDLNQPTRALEKGVRESIPGRGQVTDIGQITTERRIDELALRETGQAIGGQGTAAYQRAKLLKQGPIWDRAKREVEQERGAQATVGFFNNQLRPQTFVSDEEMAIRGAQTSQLVDRETSTALRGLDPMAVVPPKILAKVQTALEQISQRTGEPIPQNALDIMANPNAGDVQQLTTDIWNWERKATPALAGYSGSGSPEKRELQNALAVYSNAALLPEERSQIAAKSHSFNRLSGVRDAERDVRQGLLQQYPILASYLTWKKTHDSGTIDQFVAQYRPTR